MHMMIEKFASAFQHFAGASAFQHSLTTKNSGALTMIGAPVHTRKACSIKPSDGRFAVSAFAAPRGRLS
jgi:hypothetical protein